MGVTC